eukprot:CAMPEP_0204616996 /NCGR_PEP_ID=MMETSP0717-20131115/4103_1 /ASSEMBLY_ACC=CAM_ASM_000666 /TAXON_ID=230516 /ORGANISM="Chaetoceros curvisetus" /LENGTH=295 /DNA_ID=CAMNT_0051630405 /DNA_START=50 /DNA_END=937 /DNA_ORIENTATION=+
MCRLSSIATTQKLTSAAAACNNSLTISHKSVAIVANTVKAGMVLSTLLVGANYEIGHFCPLQEKLSMQGTGIGWWIDVISGQAISAICLFMFWSVYYQKKLVEELVPGMLSGFCFSLLANLFHLLLDENGEYPHWSFACAFLSLGGHLLYTFIHHVGIICGVGDKNTAKVQQLLLSTKVHLLCLIAMPFILLGSVSSSVAYDVLNRFTYHGFVFLFIGYSINTILATAAQETNVKEFRHARLCFPLLFLTFVLEGYFVRYLKIDIDVFAHFFVTIFFYQMNTGITKSYKLMAKVN